MFASIFVGVVFVLGGVWLLVHAIRWDDWIDFVITALGIAAGVVGILLIVWGFIV